MTCPLCAAKLKELDELIARMNDLLCGATRQRRVERTVIWTMAAVNAAAVFYLMGR